jgi:hypothetical protein
LDSGDQALADALWVASGVATVFSSGSGDLEILDKNCRALTQKPRALSPTLFHNSVHNAAAGYWGIANGSRAATTSLSAYDESFAAGLLEALMTADTGQDCLLIAYDIPAPPALAPVRHVKVPFAVAIALTRERSARYATRLDWAWESSRGSLKSPDLAANLMALYQSNPAARALPFLSVMARRQDRTLVWPFLKGGQLRLTFHFEDPFYVRSLSTV